MDFQRGIVCPENEELASFMKNKWQEMAQSPKGISDNLNNIFHRAYSNLCNSKTPIKSLRDLSEIRGVGKWILKLMQGFFNTDSGASENDDITEKGKRNNSTRRYVPQKHSVAYALLVTLHRGTENGGEFMRRQELIDSAEASGLSRVPIAPEKGKGKLGKFGSSPREWYSGWSCMKTLITKGLVVKSSCPAKYMLTEEGKEVAQECLSRSGLVDCNNKSDIVQRMSRLEPEDLNLSEKDMQDLAHDLASSSNEVAFPSFPSNIQKKSIDVLPESLDRDKEGREALESKFNALAMPPLDFGESFEDAYAVILVLDDREQFASQGSRSRKIIDNISSQFKTQIEVRRLPVGDAIWIAHHKCTGSEYVLDFVVERKKVDDLRMSIRDNRYKDQKLRLLRCGLKKVIYLVEGDPNSCEAAESIKTACFTTEIMEGFDVQRTSGLADTLRKYGYLTQAIKQYYKSLDSMQKSSSICPRYGEFIRRCEDLDKMTVSDVFAIQLMQVPQVTEEVVIAVLEMYPTLLSLARAYSVLDGDICAQEEMLKRQSNNLISGAASRNIFQLIWGS